MSVHQLNTKTSLKVESTICIYKYIDIVFLVINQGFKFKAGGTTQASQVMT